MIVQVENGAVAASSHPYLGDDVQVAAHKQGRTLWLSFRDGKDRYCIFGDKPEQLCAIVQELVLACRERYGVDPMAAEPVGAQGKK